MTTQEEWSNKSLAKCKNNFMWYINIGSRNNEGCFKDKNIQEIAEEIYYSYRVSLIRPDKIIINDCVNGVLLYDVFKNNNMFNILPIETVSGRREEQEKCWEEKKNQEEQNEKRNKTLDILGENLDEFLAWKQEQLELKKLKNNCN